MALAGLPATGREGTQLQLVRGLAINSSVLTQTEVNQAFYEILTELNQMVDVLFLQVVKHLCSLEGFHVDFTMTRGSAKTIC